jgi:hypothetical protein
MTYDSWKTTEPDTSHPDDKTRCPHGEDAPGGCPSCEPMSMNLEELRELASRATPGPWRVGFWGGRCHKEHVHRGSETSRADPCVYDPSFCPTEDNMIAGANGVNVVEGNYDGSVISASNAAYIAAASPSVVIGLLDEVERLTAMHAARDAATREWADIQRATLADLSRLSRDLEAMTVERNNLSIDLDAYKMLGVIHPDEAAPIVAAERDRAIQERDEAREECDVLHREYATLGADYARQNNDWNALLIEIALTVGSDDDREAAEMGEVDEFDPWHALRSHRSVALTTKPGDS